MYTSKRPATVREVMLNAMSERSVSVEQLSRRIGSTWPTRMYVGGWVGKNDEIPIMFIYDVARALEIPAIYLISAEKTYTAWYFQRRDNVL